MSSRAKLIPAVFAGAYIAIRIWMFSGSVPVFNVDSSGYLYPNAHVASLAFFSGFKPWFVPLYWRLVDGNVAVGLWLQLMISTSAWLFLANETRRNVSGRTLSFAAAILPLLLSLSPVVAQWDPEVLSESLALSLGAVVVALLLRVVRSPSRANVSSLVIASALWAGTRDTNAYLLVGLLPVVGLVLAFRKRIRLGAVLVVAAIALFGFSMWSSSSPRRWELISVDLINERVLGDPVALQFFEAHGMPNPPGLRPRMFSERVPFSRFQNDAKLAPFRRWLLANSRSTYLAYLVSHPSAALSVPLNRLDQLNSSDGIVWYRPVGFRDTPVGPLSQLLYPSRGGLILFWSLIACALAATCAVARLLRPGWWIGAALILSTIPQAVLVWDAEPREVGRHALLIGVLDRIGLAILLLFIVDGLLETRRKSGVTANSARTKTNYAASMTPV